MNAKDIIETFNRNTSVTKRQAEGLTHADSLLQAQFRANCFNWVLGHMVFYRDVVLTRLGGDSIVPEHYGKRYGHSSEPILEDGEDVANFQELLNQLDETNAALAAALTAGGDEKLASVYEVNDDGSERTFGDMAGFLAWHDAYHTGQLELLRQIAGTDDHII